eukprot:6492606-Amphidinium_carterae.3
MVKYSSLDLLQNQDFSDESGGCVLNHFVLLSGAVIATKACVCELCNKQATGTAKVQVLAFYFDGKNEPCDDACGCAFLGNFYGDCTPGADPSNEHSYGVIWIWLPRLSFWKCVNCKAWTFRVRKDAQYPFAMLRSKTLRELFRRCCVLQLEDYCSSVLMIETQLEKKHCSSSWLFIWMERV